MHDNSRRKNKKRFEGFRKAAKDQRRISRKEKRALPEYTGVVRMTREGYAFIIVDGLEEDIFVRATKTRGALNGDTVRVAVVRQKLEGKRIESEVKEIVTRSGAEIGRAHV